MKNTQRNKPLVVLSSVKTRFGNKLYDLFRCFLFNKLDPNREYKVWMRYSYNWKRYSLDDLCSPYPPKELDHTNWDMFCLINKFPQIRDEFVSNYFLKSYDNTKKVKDRFLFQIRNTDYLHFYPAVINRNIIFQKMLDCAGNLHPEIKTIDVMSEDIDYCKNNYNNLFESKGYTVNYLPTGDIFDDFERSWNYKHKLIMNSTFHYWGCYVSNLIYSYNCTIITYLSKLMNTGCTPTNAIIAEYADRPSKSTEKKLYPNGKPKHSLATSAQF